MAIKELIKIQSALNAPKSQRNSFGNYNYRSCEDILKALKPLLFENDCMVTITDEVAHIGDRYYIKATATISNSEGLSISVSGYAREPLAKRGMDDSQITGATSSYARKYALNGLFAIDDTKDADSQDNRDYEISANKLTKEQVIEIEELLITTDSDKEKFLAWFKAKKVEDVDYDRAIAILSKKIQKGA